MTKKELGALVLSLQLKLQWVTSEIDKRDAILRLRRKHFH